MHCSLMMGINSRQDDDALGAAIAVLGTFVYSEDARLKYLKQRLSIPFDGTSSEHQDVVRQVWRLSYPDRQLPSLKSEVWKDMGWQGYDPLTDFISLENLIFFAKTYLILHGDWIAEKQLLPFCDVLPDYFGDYQLGLA